MEEILVPDELRVAIHSVFVSSPQASDPVGGTSSREEAGTPSSPSLEQVRAARIGTGASRRASQIGGIVGRHDPAIHDHGRPRVEGHVQLEAPSLHSLCGLDGAAEPEFGIRLPVGTIDRKSAGSRRHSQSGSLTPGRPPSGRCGGSSATLGWAGRPPATAGMLSIPYRQSGTPSRSSSVTTPYAIHCSCHPKQRVSGTTTAAVSRRV